MSEIDLTQLPAIVDRIGRDRPATIPLLQAVQEQYRYLPADALDRLAELTDIPRKHFENVSRYFRIFRHEPAGEHTIHVCHGTACHVKGAPAVHDAILRHLQIADGSDTDDARRFTVQKVACLGCCTLAPAVKIDAITYGHLTSETVGEMIDNFLDRKQRGEATARPLPDVDRPAGEIRLGLGSCCVSRGSGQVREAVEQALRDTHAPVSLRRVGCVGMCHQTPLVEVVEASGESHLYAHVTPGDARKIVLKHFSPQGLGATVRTWVDRGLEMLLDDRARVNINRQLIEPRDPHIRAFLGPQKHIVSEHFGDTDPTDLQACRQQGGFEALRRVLEQDTPEALIEQIAHSELAGRGGAGYPTGLKWSHVFAAEGARKHVICNGDEGDPGAFMDRMLLESHPYRVLEGMAIAAFAVGADDGVCYIRWEYPLAVSRMQEAIRRCTEAGLLGENIFGSDFSFRVRVFEGAGAFVCGEETALIRSLEGHPGRPRKRPPYPANKGLFGEPTLVNNVETLANVPWIIRHGSEAYRQIGTDGSRGTKVFALAGKIERGGLIEVPMGTTIRQIVEQIGGGLAGGRALKAVQIGGPSGGCVPAHLADAPIDFQALGRLGTMMGSGGMVVLAEDDCMVDIARYFLQFTHTESCGLCKMCKQGSKQMLDILDRIVTGEGTAEDLDAIAELCEQIPAGSLCGLGKTATNPVVSTLQHFRDEYEAHLAGHCPTGTCPVLTTFEITDDCIGCTLCAQHCPVDAITPRPHERHEIDQQDCIRCGSCQRICPADAVRVR
jgi:NADH-quinone oxidoreductase subunit F